MDKSQSKIFGDELSAIFEIYGKEAPTKSVKLIWWKILAKYELGLVLKALSIHAESSQFFPKPADIVEILTTSDGRPTADEAWAIALQGQDEGGSVVWTEEISQAFLSIAMPILESGDKVGARIGFRDNYNRRVEYARRNGISVVWFMSAGTNKQIASDVAREAERLGRISSQAASKYLISDMTSEGADIAGLIGYSGKKIMDHTSKNDSHKKNIERLRSALSGGLNTIFGEQAEGTLEDRRDLLIKQSIGGGK